jgi:hypothetical protein
MLDKLFQNLPHILSRSLHPIFNLAHLRPQGIGVDTPALVSCSIFIHSFCFGGFLILHLFAKRAIANADSNFE